MAAPHHHARPCLQMHSSSFTSTLPSASCYDAVPLTFLDYSGLCSRPTGTQGNLYGSLNFSQTFSLKGIKDMYHFSPCLGFKVCWCRSSEADRPTHPSSGDYKMLSMWLEFSWIQRMRREALNGNVFSYSSSSSITGDGTIATLWFQK